MIEVWDNSNYNHNKPVCFDGIVPNFYLVDENDDVRGGSGRVVGHSVKKRSCSSDEDTLWKPDGWSCYSS